MRISICLAIAITLIALLAQQAHGWAQTCADGNTDVCCHLEQHGWSFARQSDLTSIEIQILNKQLDPLRQCDLAMQAEFDNTVPLMCQSDCWGGAIAFGGHWTTMPTQAAVLNSGCRVDVFVNGACPPARSSSSTASATASATESSSTASPMSSTASATETDHIEPGATSGRDDDHAYMNAAASASPLLMRTPIALAIALASMHWH